MSDAVKRNAALNAFRVEEDTQVVLGLLAEARGMSVAQVVREALDAYAASDRAAEEITRHKSQRARIDKISALADD